MDNGEWLTLEQTLEVLGAEITPPNMNALLRYHARIRQSGVSGFLDEPVMNGDVVVAHIEGQPVFDQRYLLKPFNLITSAIVPTARRLRPYEFVEREDDVELDSPDMAQEVEAKRLRELVNLFSRVRQNMSRRVREAKAKPTVLYVGKLVQEKLAPAPKAPAKKKPAIVKPAIPEGKEIFTLHETIRFLMRSNIKTKPEVLQREALLLGQFLQERLKNQAIAKELVNTEVTEVSVKLLPFLERNFLTALPDDKKNWIRGKKGCALLGISVSYSNTVNAVLHDIWLNEWAGSQEVIGRFFYKADIGILMHPERFKEAVTADMVKQKYAKINGAKLTEYEWRKGSGVCTFFGLHTSPENNAAVQKLLSEYYNLNRESEEVVYDIKAGSKDKDHYIRFDVLEKGTDIFGKTAGIHFIF